jgi:hypothetical protein
VQRCPNCARARLARRGDCRVERRDDACCGQRARPLHIAVTQARHATEGRAYLDRRRTDGKSTREAMRALKRFLTRRIWHLWQECVASSPRLNSPT